MSLKKCAKCGELFSDSYHSCPFCAEDEEYYRGNVRKGRRHSNGRKKRPGLALPLLALVLVVLIGGGLWYFLESGMQNISAGDEKNPSAVDVTQQTDGEQKHTAPVVLVMDKTMRLAPDESKPLLISGGTDYEWTSSDPTVAAVGGDGTVTAVSEGTAIITVTDSSGASAVCSVTVAEKADEPITENPNEGDTGNTTTKPIKPSDGSTTTKVDMSKLKFSIPAYGLDLTPTADGSYDMSIMKSLGESSVEITIEGTTNPIVWTSDNEDKVTASAGKTEDGKLTVTFKAVGSGEATITGKCGESSVSFLVRVK